MVMTRQDWGLGAPVARCLLGFDTGKTRVAMVVRGMSKFIIYILPGSTKFSRPALIST